MFLFFLLQLSSLESWSPNEWNDTQVSIDNQNINNCLLSVCPYKMAISTTAWAPHTLAHLLSSFVRFFFEGIFLSKISKQMLQASLFSFSLRISSKPSFKKMITNGLLSSNFVHLVSQSAWVKIQILLFSSTKTLQTLQSYSLESRRYTTPNQLDMTISLEKQAIDNNLRLGV